MKNIILITAIAVLSASCTKFSNRFIIGEFTDKNKTVEYLVTDTHFIWYYRDSNEKKIAYYFTGKDRIRFEGMIPEYRIEKMDNFGFRLVEVNSLVVGGNIIEFYRK